jgi:hypothetical protein
VGGTQLTDTGEKKLQQVLQSARLVSNSCRKSDLLTCIVRHVKKRPFPGYAAKLLPNAWLAGRMA